MSDSDSELSSAPTIPSDATLEKGLRDAVAKVFKTNNRDDLTVKRMRTAAEKALDLPEGFFKGDDRWKADSERIIKDEADVQETKREEKPSSEEEKTPVKAKPKKAPPKPKEKSEKKVVKPKEKSEKKVVKPKEKPEKKVVVPKEKPEKKVVVPKEKPEKKASKPPKRASPDESSKPAKRQKTATSDESEDELSSPPSDESEEKPKVKKETVAVKSGRARPKGSSKPKKESTATDSDEEEEAVAATKASSKPKGGTKVAESDEEEEVAAASKKTKAEDFDDEDSSHEPPEKTNGAAKHVDSESEMSEVHDPTPKPKRQRRKSFEVSSKAEKKSKKPSKAKEDSNITPNEAEIKRLQGWLIKCGIRKMWFRELAPYDTPKEKIRHLKGMLKDAGMDGRYSVEKAAQIKEERELKADLEMVKEGAKRWGAESDSEEAEVDDNGRPKRKLARGLRNVDFLDSDDGEETS